jgi:hypothetical protein
MRLKMTRVLQCFSQSIGNEQNKIFNLRDTKYALCVLSLNMPFDQNNNKISYRSPCYRCLNVHELSNATVPLMRRRSRGDKDTEPGAIHNT